MASKMAGIRAGGMVLGVVVIALVALGPVVPSWSVERGFAVPEERCDGHRATAVVTDSATDFHGGADRDVIVGTSGDDGLYGGPGNDIICSRGGNDFISGESGRDRLFGQAGQDHVQGNENSDFISLGDGDDKGPITFRGTTCCLVGIALGGGGADTIRGELGNDDLSGEPGNDLLIGSDGEDNLTGGDGSDDTCKGGPGTDTDGGGCETVRGVP